MHPAHPAAAHSTPGKAAYQQDRHLVHHSPPSTLLAVFDGHGSPAHGHLVAAHLAAHLPALLHAHAVLPHPPPLCHAAPRLRAAIAELDASAIAVTSAARLYAGSTLCAVLVGADAHADVRDQHTPRLLVANVGDSRAVVVGKATVRALTQDHVVSVPAERARVEAAGGWVVGGMVNGYISMTRALGDDDLKAHRNVTPFQRPPPGAPRRFGERLFVGEADVWGGDVRADEGVVVVASDGVWSKVRNEEVAAVVRRVVAAGGTAHDVSRAVVRRALKGGTRDNVTAVVGFLKGEEEVRDVLGGTEGSSSSDGLGKGGVQSGMARAVARRWRAVAKGRRRKRWEADEEDAGNEAGDEAGVEAGDEGGEEVDRVADKEADWDV